MKTISIDLVKKRHEQLQQIDGTKEVLLRDLAKELGIKPTELMDFFESFPNNYSLVSKENKGKKSLFVVKVYETISDNPETKEWLDRKIKENKKTIELSYYNNYGHVSGYYLCPSKNKESEFLNTKEKLQDLKEKLSLKKGGYHFGGMGDSSYHTDESWLEIGFDQLEVLKKEGWAIIGRYEKDSFYMS